LRTWGEAVVTQRPWIEAMAAAVGEKFVYLHDRPPDFKDFPGASAVKEVYSVEGRSGVWKTFKANVDRRRIRIRYDTPAYDLIQDGDTLEIFGVYARSNDETVAIRARRAVVMCCGSFEANVEMQRNYCGYELMYSFGNPGNSGDGVLMLQKAGAELWHLSNKGQVGGIFPAIKVPEYSAVFHRGFITASSYIEIAKDNRRYYDETGDYDATHYKLLVHDHWVDSLLPKVLPVHMIFDEATRTGGSFSGTVGWNKVALEYEWSPDNSKEVERGWIERADSLRDLAAKMGRDPDVVEAAVERWNEACAAGRDDEFGRDPTRMQPIVGPPYYSVEIVPGVAATGGGARRDSQSRVVAQRGGPIPRLYEAGELGSIMANLYQSGSFLTEALVFGRIAGRNAVREQPW
jgi:succinate dehydrogenase/fumarate reductase flavoprotein subunit